MIEANTIKSIIEKSYINGIHGKRNIQDIEEGFHSSFSMLVKKDNRMTKVSLNQWLINLEGMIRENPELWNQQTNYSITNIDQNKDTASAKIAVYKGDTYFSTDYMLLYKFDEGWKIVSKVFSI